MTTPRHRVWPPDPEHPAPVVETHRVATAVDAETARWSMLQARDVMRKDVVTIDASTLVSDVERILSERGIGGAPVTDDQGRIVGIVSMRDLLRRRAHAAADPDADFDGFLRDEDVPAVDRRHDGLHAATAAEVMSPKVYWVDADASLGDLARTMVTQRVHRVLVRENDRYAGIVGTLDVLHALAG